MVVWLMTLTEFHMFHIVQALFSCVILCSKEYIKIETFSRSGREKIRAAVAKLLGDFNKDAGKR